MSPGVCRDWGIWRDARRFATLRSPRFWSGPMATKVKRARAKKTASKKASATRPGARRQPETLRLRKIAPSFTATDLQRSIAFYRDVLGFVIGEEWREASALAGCARSCFPARFMLPADTFSIKSESH